MEDAQAKDTTAHTEHEHHEGCEHTHSEQPKPVLCVATLQFDEFHSPAAEGKSGGWTFYHSSYPMFSAKQLDQISDTVGTMGMPEVFYGFNHLYIANPSKDLLLEFSPVPALSLSAFVAQQRMLRSKGEASLAEGLSQLGLGAEASVAAAVEEERKLNLVDIVPRLIEVKEANLWKKKDMSKVKDFKQIEIISDWTYSTPYKGNVFKLSRHAKRVKLETSLVIPAEAVPSSNLHVELAPEGTEIPLSRLGRDNPIVHFGEIYLYEDDLGDQGYTCCSLRYRVMNDCFYVLHRYYLRVDEVLVRIYDTRLFHSFDTGYILREFQHKESSYEELRGRGFKLNSEWSLSKQQADEVFP